MRECPVRKERHAPYATRCTTVGWLVEFIALFKAN